MKVIKKSRSVQKQLLSLAQKGKSVGFVPTLGFLHEGHQALIKKAKTDNDVVVVSTFVNPRQFRKKQYNQYPRDFERDRDICKKLGVDFMFVPEVDEIYPESFDTQVEVVDLAGRLEGNTIAWHYRAVATIVLKLLNIAMPTRAYFGKKDPHQLAIIKRMCADLSHPTKIIGVSTKRGRAGIALSSRNSLLSPDELKILKKVPTAIKKVCDKIKRGENDTDKLRTILVIELEKEPTIKIDFADVLDSGSLLPGRIEKEALVYVAVYVGGKRLTDNRTATVGRF